MGQDERACGIVHEGMEEQAAHDEVGVGAGEVGPAHEKADGAADDERGLDAPVAPPRGRPGCARTQHGGKPQPVARPKVLGRTRPPEPQDTPIPRGDPGMRAPGPWHEADGRETIRRRGGASTIAWDHGFSVAARAWPRPFDCRWVP